MMMMMRERERERERERGGGEVGHFPTQYASNFNQTLLQWEDLFVFVFTCVLYKQTDKYIYIYIYI